MSESGDVLAPGTTEMGSVGRWRVLLAEDHDSMRELIASQLRRDGYEVIEARSGLELLHGLASLLDDAPVAIDVIVTDVRMPGLTGLQVLSSMARAERCPPIVVMTAFADERLRAEALANGAVAVLDKPFDIDDLRVVLARVLANAGSKALGE